MNHGGIRALEDERDPERRKALLERLLASLGALSARELWELLPLEQKRDIASGLSVRQYSNLHWGDLPNMSLADAREGWCPRCAGKQGEDDEGEPTLDFTRMATVDTDANGFHLAHDAVGEVGPMHVSCSYCYSEWLVGGTT